MQEQKNSWSANIATGCYILLGALVYTYLLMFALTFNFKTDCLDMLNDVTILTEKVIHNLVLLDQNIMNQLEFIDKFYDGTTDDYENCNTTSTLIDDIDY